MSLYFRDATGNRKSVVFDYTRAQVLGRGGAGIVYVHPNDPASTLKVYHTHFLSAHPQLKKKLESMLSLPPGEEEVMVSGQRYVQIAWPTSLLEDDTGRLLGYAMPLVDMGRSVMLEQLLQKQERRLVKLREDYQFRVYVACNLSRVIAKLHEKGHGVVDMKPVNVLAYRDTGYVCLLDCDGYDVRGEDGVRHRADLFTAEYLYPEGHTKKLRPDAVDPLEQDKFSLAVILFQLLNNGLHPYQGRPIANDVPPSIGERIAEGLYCYGRKKNRRQEPAAQTMHEYFEDSTRDLFDRAFESGRARPSAREWVDHFGVLTDQKSQILRHCASGNPEHQHFSKGCGLCALNGVPGQKVAPPPILLSSSSEPFISGANIKVILVVLAVVVLILFLEAHHRETVDRDREERRQLEVDRKARESKPEPKPAPKPDQHPISSSGDPAGAIELFSFVDEGGTIHLTDQPGDPRYRLVRFAHFAKKQGPLTKIEFVHVPGGTFEMGCGSWQSDCGDDEKPPHTVMVGSFEIGKHEVTQGQWKAVMESNPSEFSSCGNDCPVENVSWDDVQEFIQKLNARGQGKYRLPTEAEWEYACRSGGKPEKYCGGNDFDRLAWHNGNSGSPPLLSRQTHPVGLKSVNGLGIYDMSGNVYEWTCSDYGKYDDGGKNHAKCSSGGSYRVVRGGSWYNAPAGARSAIRYGIDLGRRRGNLGLRLARTNP